MPGGESWELGIGIWQACHVCAIAQVRNYRWEAEVEPVNSRRTVMLIVSPFENSQKVEITEFNGSRIFPGRRPRCGFILQLSAISTQSFVGPNKRYFSRVPAATRSKQRLPSLSSTLEVFHHCPSYPVDFRKLSNQMDCNVESGGQRLQEVAQLPFSHP